MSRKKEGEKGFEESMRRLEELVGRMEEGNLTLDEMVASTYPLRANTPPVLLP